MLKLDCDHAVCPHIKPHRTYHTRTLMRSEALWHSLRRGREPELEKKEGRWDKLPWQRGRKRFKHCSSSLLYSYTKCGFENNDLVLQMKYSLLAVTIRSNLKHAEVTRLLMIMLVLLPAPFENWQSICKGTSNKFSWLVALPSIQKPLLL